MPAEAPIIVDPVGDFPSLPVLNSPSPGNCADEIRMQLTSLDIDEKAKKADGEEHAQFVFTLDENYLKRFSCKLKDAAEKLRSLCIMSLLFSTLQLSVGGTSSSWPNAPTTSTLNFVTFGAVVLDGLGALLAFTPAYALFGIGNEVNTIREAQFNVCAAARRSLDAFRLPSLGGAKCQCNIPDDLRRHLYIMDDRLHAHFHVYVIITSGMLCFLATCITSVITTQPAFVWVPVVVVLSLPIIISLVAGVLLWIDEW